MTFNFEEATIELFKKYNLEYVKVTEDRNKYWEGFDYLRTHDCYIELYGYAWTVNSSNRSLRYNRTPVFGKFYINHSGRRIFDEYDLKRPGKVKKSVDGEIRHYATSYVEAAEGYNKLIDKHLELIKQLEDWANSYRIY